MATLDDTVPEAEEGFTVVLSNPEGADDDDTGEGTITDGRTAGDRRRAGSG